MKYENPIIKGFYPDPSVCKFKNKFYLVNSSFGYFPSIPIFVSEDVINWKQLGYVLNKREQIDLKSSGVSGGVYAPTIRTDGKRLYVIYTNVSIMRNFIVSTLNPNLGWSNPIEVENWVGIDPSLFFDDDGSVYVQGTSGKNEKEGIYQAKINITTGKLLSNRKLISTGTGGKSPEAPHVYKKNGTYYLLLAEGGTEYGHMVTIFRSENIDGPYEGDKQNPILSNRSTGIKIQCVGHADFFKDNYGNYWLVALGIRRIGHHAYYHFIGRETLLAPVEWDNNWPTVNGNGHVYKEMEGPLLNPQKRESNNILIDFSKVSKIPVRFIYLRDRKSENYILNKKMGLKLKASKGTLDTTQDVTFLGIRQSELKVSYESDFEVGSNNFIKFGITAFMSKDYHYDLYVDMKKSTINLKVRVGSISQIIESFKVNSIKNVNLKIESDEKNYYFKAIIDAQKFDLGYQNTNLLSSEISGTFTGVILGNFAQSNDNLDEVYLKEIRYVEINRQ
jgi:alpha-N-arabinofuranosidase